MPGQQCASSSPCLTSSKREKNLPKNLARGFNTNIIATRSSCAIVPPPLSFSLLRRSLHLILLFKSTSPRLHPCLPPKQPPCLFVITKPGLFPCQFDLLWKKKKQKFLTMAMTMERPLQSPSPPLLGAVFIAVNNLQRKCLSLECRPPNRKPTIALQPRAALLLLPSSSIIALMI